MADCVTLLFPTVLGISVGILASDSTPGLQEIPTAPGRSDQVILGTS